MKTALNLTPRPPPDPGIDHVRHSFIHQLGIFFLLQLVRFTLLGAYLHRISFSTNGLSNYGDKRTEPSNRLHDLVGVDGRHGPCPYVGAFRCVARSWA
jgi:hypothetical protein